MGYSARIDAKIESCKNTLIGPVQGKNTCDKLVARLTLLGLMPLSLPALALDAIAATGATFSSFVLRGRDEKLNEAALGLLKGCNISHRFYKIALDILYPKASFEPKKKGKDDPITWSGLKDHALKPIATIIEDNMSKSCSRQVLARAAIVVEIIALAIFAALDLVLSPLAVLGSLLTLGRCERINKFADDCVSTPYLAHIYQLAVEIIKPFVSNKKTRPSDDIRTA